MNNLEIKAIELFGMPLNNIFDSNSIIRYMRINLIIVMYLVGCIKKI